jgi:hypothetical protein
VLDESGDVVWHIVNARTRAVFPLGEEPPASESDGVADRVDPSAGDDV